MKLTPIQDYHISGTPFEPTTITANSPEEAVTLLFADTPPPAGTTLTINAVRYRIDPDPAPVPSVGWVPGKPPKDGKWYVIHQGTMPGVVYYNSDAVAFVDDNYCPVDLITHHNPTPISLEIP